MKLNNSFELLAKAKKFIPSITQTFSRAPSTFVEGVFPVYAEKAFGSHFVDVDGNEYVDYLCGLGPVILGYAYPSVDRAIKEQLQRGILFSIPNKLEIEVSELLCNLIPSAEMVQFSKTGSGAATGAVRAARAITGRDGIAYCGTGGVWHDWYASIISRNQGVPKFNYDLIHPFEYNKIESLEKIFEENKNKIACVFMEPTLLEKPEDSFLNNVKKLTKENNAILIFDEIVTAFRFSNGGAQEYFGVEPDITVLGKGIANGMPLSAVVGKEEYMKIFDKIFFSTTYAGELLSLAAAKATINEFKEKPIIKTIWNTGQYLMNEFNKIANENSLDLSLNGFPVRIKPTAKNCSDNESVLIRSLLVQEMVKKGVFMHPGIDYISYSHNMDDVQMTLNAFNDCIPILKKGINENNVEKLLEGKPAKVVYTVEKNP
jgi:glutamate-1-semialdehyde 2,1-aminomutase